MKGSPVVAISSIVALTILLIPFGDSKYVQSCSMMMRCSTVPDHTYGLVENTCHVYRNPCLLGYENCDRKAAQLPLIVPTPKAECVPLCPTMCPMFIDEICGEYLNQKKTFNNHCEMDRFNCLNEKTYRLYSPGPCV